MLYLGRRGYDSVNLKQPSVRVGGLRSQTNQNSRLLESRAQRHRCSRHQRFSATVCLFMLVQTSSSIVERLFGSNIVRVNGVCVPRGVSQECLSRSFEVAQSCSPVTLKVEQGRTWRFMDVLPGKATLRIQANLGRGGTNRFPLEGSRRLQPGKGCGSELSRDLICHQQRGLTVQVYCFKLSITIRCKA
jgi:hypothetical protein